MKVHTMGEAAGSQQASHDDDNEKDTLRFRGRLKRVSVGGGVGGISKFILLGRYVRAISFPNLSLQHDFLLFIPLSHLEFQEQQDHYSDYAVMLEL